MLERQESGRTSRGDASGATATLKAGVVEVTRAWVRWIEEHPDAAALVDHVTLDGDFGEDHRGRIQVYIIDELGQPAVDLVAESLGLRTNNGFVPPKFEGTAYRQWALYGDLFSVSAVVGRIQIPVGPVR